MRRVDQFNYRAVAMQIEANRRRQIEYLTAKIAQPLVWVPNLVAIDPVWSPAQGCKLR